MFTSVNHCLKKWTSLLLAVVLPAAVLFVSIFVPGAVDVQAGEITGINTAVRHVVCENLSEAAQAYYTGSWSIENLQALSGAADPSDSFTAAQNNPLYTALQDLMQSTLDRSSLPVYSGYGAGSLAYYWNRTDTSPDVDNSKSSHFLLFYSDAVYEYPGSKVSMNREHIWAKSHASFHQMNGGSDLHHLRPSVSTVNDAKSDHIFGYVDEVYAAGYDTGYLDEVEVYKAYIDKDIFEPKDDVKGDIARILLYVYCCWGQPNLYSDVDAAYLPAGDADEVTNTGGRVITDLDTLLTWCEDDPVDTWEMERNDLAQELQGNRNVFIDYPELAWQLFGRDTPAGIQTPTQTGCAHVRDDAFIEDGGCTEPGMLYSTCRICGNVHKEPVPAPGHIDEDHNYRCDRCDTILMGSYTRMDRISDGTHLLLYHPASGKVMTPVVNSSGRMNGIHAVENDGVINPDQEAAIFHVETVQSGGFHLVNGGRYLTTPKNGGRLLWSDSADEYSTWFLADAGEGGVYIVNASAVSSRGSAIAMEMFNNAFTTYGGPDGDAFRFQLFTSDEHKWERVSYILPTPEAPGEVTYICAACGETLTEVIPIRPPASETHTVTYVVENGTWSDGSSDPFTEEVRDGETPSVIPEGMTAAEGYEGGGWDIDPADTVIMEDTTFTYTFKESEAPAEPVAHTVVYAVENGTWEDGSSGALMESVEDGSTPSGIPAGMIPAEGFEGGAWNIDPAGTAVRDNTLFIYSFTEVPAPPEPVLHTVLYLVENGSWEDGTADPIVVTAEDGQTPDFIPTGMIPLEGLEEGGGEGFWDMDPADAVIMENTVFTYTFPAEAQEEPAVHTVIYLVENGTWGDGDADLRTEEVEEGRTPSAIPAGMTAAEGFEGGAWDMDPAIFAITKNTVFTYTFTEQPAPPEPIEFTVAYVVKNGIWQDGTADPLTGKVEDGQIPDPVPTGMTAAEGFEGGVWNLDPVETVITKNTVFVYSFSEKQQTPPEEPPEDPPGEPLPIGGDYCPVTWDPDGGTFSEASLPFERTTQKYVQPVYKGTVIRILAAPDREGYTFLYWECDGKAYQPGEEYTVEEKDRVFTAKWEKRDEEPADGGQNTDEGEDGQNTDDAGGGTDDADDGRSGDPANGGDPEDEQAADGTSGHAGSGTGTGTGTGTGNGQSTSVSKRRQSTAQPKGTADKASQQAGSANTGDESGLLLWLVLLCASSGSLLAVWRMRS